MSAPGGYSLTPGMYRVPDLMTEQQLIDYFRYTYGKGIEIFDIDSKGERIERDENDNSNDIAAARALGQSANIAPFFEVDDNTDVKNMRNRATGVDPVLRSINEMTVPDAYDTTPLAYREESEPELVDKSETQTRDEALENADPGDDETVESDSQYANFSKTDLQNLCRERDLSTSGTKQQLVERLEENDRSREENTNDYDDYTS